MSIEIRKVGKCIVKKYLVYGFTHPLYVVLEHTEFHKHTHHTITTIDGQWYGHFTTKKPPAHLRKLPPYTQERANAISTYYHKRKQAAYRIAQLAFPGEEIHF